jgi:hypothetical protein
MTKERKETPYVKIKKSAVITRKHVVFLVAVFMLNFLCSPMQSQTEKEKEIKIANQVWASPYKT